MKTALLFIALLPFACLSQDKKMEETAVPSEIKTFIDQNYPAAGKVHYTKEYSATGTFIVAAFDYGAIAYALQFEDVKLVAVMKEIEFESIPSRTKMTSYLDQKYLKYKIRKCAEVTTNGELTYEILIDCNCNPDAIYRVSFSPDGTWLTSLGL